MLVLGIDGGGTKTTALLADGEGRILGRGFAGSSNYHTIGLAAAGEALLEGIRAAFAEAEEAPRPVAAACLGLAGVDRPEDRELIRAWAREARVAEEVLVVNDGAIVLAAGTPDNWGVAVISGTGSIAWGRNPDGATARAGGGGTRTAPPPAPGGGATCWGTRAAATPSPWRRCGPWPGPPTAAPRPRPSRKPSYPAWGSPHRRR